MKVAVLANGEWDAEWGRLELVQVDFLISADGGGNHALASGRLPEVLIGDLDSITPENLALCRQKDVLIQQFPREKDETDLELALEFAIRHLSSTKLKDSKDSKDSHTVWLYGATGGRIDHLLGNLALLLRFLKKGYRIHLKDPSHEIYLINKGQEALKGHLGKELSLLPITETARVTSKGLYYPLKSDVLYQDSPRGISNVFLGEDAVVQVDEGIVLITLLV